MNDIAQNIVCKQWTNDFEVNGYQIEDILCLIKKSYGERAKEGISFVTLNYTIDDFLKARTEEDFWFLAFDEDNSLDGTARLSILGNYGIVCNFAVLPQRQGRHVGARLLQAINRFAKEHKLNYVISSTAMKAASSVKCHCNNDFQKVGISIGLNRNYSSFVFRNQLSPSFLWDSSIFINTRFFLTYLIYRLCKTSDGKNTLWGNLLYACRIRL